jgi:hypothetical protein
MPALPGREIELPDWTVDTVECALPATEPADQRADGSDGTAHVPARYDPVVCLPRTTFDCVNLDALKDHPAVDPLVRAQLDQGASFRLLRFPFSLRPARGSSVNEVRFTIQLDQTDALGPPRVHSIYPLRLTVDEERKTEVTFEPSLKLGSALDVRGGKIGRTVTVSQARATTVGFWSEFGADWILRASDKGGAAIEGTSEFLVVVRWEHGVTPLGVTLSFSAMVGTPFLRWGTRRVERTYAPLALTGCQPVA